MRARFKVDPGEFSGDSVYVIAVAILKNLSAIRSLFSSRVPLIYADHLGIKKNINLETVHICNCVFSLLLFFPSSLQNKTVTVAFYLPLSF